MQNIDEFNKTFEQKPVWRRAEESDARAVGRWRRSGHYLATIWLLSGNYLAAIRPPELKRVLSDRMQFPGLRIFCISAVSMCPRGNDSPKIRADILAELPESVLR